MPCTFQGVEYRIGRSRNLGLMPYDWRHLGPAQYGLPNLNGQVYRDGAGRLILTWQPINSEWRSCAYLLTEAEILSSWS